VVNRYLLDELAREGRGQVQYFLPGSSVRDEVATFYDRVKCPYLTDVQLVWRGVDVEDAQPSRVPDLFGGQPLCVQARYRGGRNASLEVRGNIAGRPWSKRVVLDLPQRESGDPAIGALWARARIADLEREDLHGADASVADEITRLGLSHRLVTKYTSFVAVEDKMVVSNGRPTRVTVPVEMPEGVSYEGVFGEADAAPGYVGGRSLSSNTAPSAKRMEVSSPPPGNALSLSDDRAAQLAPGAPAEESEIKGRERHKERQDGKPARLVLKLAADRTALRSGEDVTLVVTLENAGGSPADVPATLTLGDGLLRIRVLDSTWQETVLGVAAAGSPMPVRTAMKPLRAGETRRFTIRLGPAEAAFLRKPGVYHLYVSGGPLGVAGDSERITIRIT
jgi:hypothetical protein